MAKKLTQIIDTHFELKKDNIIYISGEYTKFHVVKFFGNILSTYDETSTLREDWNYYNSIHGEDFIRLLDGFMADYNPIENYDRYEDTKVKFDKGAQTDQIISASKTAHTENKVSAFDTEGYSNSSKIDNTQDGFTDSSVNGSREDKTDTTSHIHGNIGVTTNAQMLSGEALIRYNNLVDKYIDRWVQSVIVGYDEGYADTPASYDDYATKAELNAVKNDVNDLEDSVDSITASVNALGQTVAAATADITTLYSQTDNLRTDLNGVDDIVQSTVADVEELQTEAENLDTRVTALEQGGGGGVSIVPLQVSDVFINLQHVRIDNWHAYKIDNKIVVINCALVCTDSWSSNQTAILGDINPEHRPLSPLMKTSSYGTNYTQIYLSDEQLKIRPVSTTMGVGFTSLLDITYIMG